MDSPTPADMAQDAGELDLDISVVEAGPAVDALPSSTDNGCDTVRGSDC